MMPAVTSESLELYQTTRPCLKPPAGGSQVSNLSVPPYLLNTPGRVSFLVCTDFFKFFYFNTLLIKKKKKILLFYIPIALTNTHTLSHKKQGATEASLFLPRYCMISPLTTVSLLLAHTISLHFYRYRHIYPSLSSHPIYIYPSLMSLSNLIPDMLLQNNRARPFIIAINDVGGLSVNNFIHVFLHPAH